MKPIIAVALLATALTALHRGELGIVAVLAVGVAMLLKGQAMRVVAGHSHPGVLVDGANHEAGHAAAARAVGGQVVSGRLNPNGSGVVWARVPDNPLARMTVLLAGAEAAGTDLGADYDFAEVDRVLAEVPRVERSAVLRDAQNNARRIVRRHAGEIERDAAQLLERGRL